MSFWSDDPETPLKRVDREKHDKKLQRLNDVLLGAILLLAAAIWHVVALSHSVQ